LVFDLREPENCRRENLFLMSEAFDTLEEKIKKSRQVIGEAYERFPVDQMAVAWTGGKDSTLLLWLVRGYALAHDKPLPRFMFINEGHVFDEVKDFVARVAAEWDLEVHEVKNDDVLAQVQRVGDPVYIDRLNERNRRELKRLGFEEASFPFEPESYVGNHLMKTVAMNVWVEEQDILAVMTGIRWDEQEARADETYFSPRHDPDHVRVHPLLHFTERDVWEAIQAHSIPYVKLYEEGYRSLGAAHTTTKVADVPAWEQDLDNTPERAGRRQDKEGIMEMLRALGYM
jgi:phosphoadenosine phosphosulfate reductase